MKTRFLRRRNALLAPGALSIGAGILAVALLFVLVRLVAPGLSIAIATPFWNAGSSLSAGTYTAMTSFGNAANLAKERDALKAENVQLLAERGKLSAQVADLTKLLGARPAAKSGIPASVLARPPFSSYDILVVDEGSEAGVVAGDPVTALAGVPIGTVASAAGSSARIVLYSAPGTETPGWAGNARIPVTLFGEGGGAFSLSIPKDAKLSVGDTIYLPGEGAIPVATILRLDADPSSAFMTARLKPVLNLFSLTWVEISKGGAP
ncbi:MAG: rod shape-determining protein MreC [bacterium]